jgi:isopenicillin-N N-acyltransferase like protein
MPSSAVRLQRLRAGAQASATLDDFRGLLADHADYPHSICAHPVPDAHPLEQSATIASVLMDASARRLWLATGNPCQTPYRELDVSWLYPPAQADPPTQAAPPAQAAPAPAQAAV